MKANMTLEELAKEIMRREETKADYIAPTEKIGVHVAADPAVPEVVQEHETESAAVAEPKRDMHLQVNGRPLPLNDHAHGQLASRLGIPKRYYDRLKDNHPYLLAANVDGLFKREPAKFMVRTLDDSVRAILSDRFRPYDNGLALEALLPVVMERPEMEIKSQALTEKRLYIQAVDKSLATSVMVKGKECPIFSGFTFSNSEVGCGAFVLAEYTWTQWCSNGATWDKELSRNHVGSKLNPGTEGEVADYFEDDTIWADAQAMQLKLRDTLKHLLSAERHQARMVAITEATERPITKPLSEVIEVTAKRMTLSQKEGEGILMHLAAGGDLTAWGLHSAITRHAQDVPADRAHELERVSTGIIEMTRSQWNDTYQMAAPKAA